MASTIIRPDSPSSTHSANSPAQSSAAPLPGWTSSYAAGRVVHLIGIGGCGMRGLAGVLLRCGARVSGSDRNESNAVRRLGESGVQVQVGQAPENLPDRCDLVVYSAAIHDQNPELVEAGLAYALAGPTRPQELLAIPNANLVSAQSLSTDELADVARAVLNDALDLSRSSTL